MVGRVRAWIGRICGILVMTVGVGAVLYLSVLGLRGPEQRSHDVSAGEVLSHLLRGDAPPERPKGMAPIAGAYPVCAPPTEQELRANLRKSFAAWGSKPVEPLYASK